MPRPPVDAPSDNLAPIADAPAFSLPIRVYWEDTDAGGVVYHASYLRFMERARTEGLRTLGLSQQVLQEQADRVFVVRDMQIDFRAPARLDDLLEVRSSLLRPGRASLVFAQEIVRPGDGRVLVQARVRVACLVASSFRPCALPALVRERIQESLHLFAHGN